MKPINKLKAKFALFFTPIWWFLKIFSTQKKIHLSEINTILIFDFHLIGDIVLLIPLLRALRNQYYKSRIVLVSGPWASEILANSLLVDEVIHYSAPWVKKTNIISAFFSWVTLVSCLRKRSWDIGIEVRGDIRQILTLWFSGPIRRIGFNFTGGEQLLTDVILMPDLQHLLDHNIAIANYLNVNGMANIEAPMISLSAEERNQAGQITPYIGLHFGASLRLRRLPFEEINFLIRKIMLKSNLPLVIFFTMDDSMEFKNFITSIAESSSKRISVWSGDLRKFIVYASRATYFYCMDSGPAHIVAALKIPLTVFYGPSEYQYVKPIGENIQIVSKDDILCRPCNQVTCKNKIYQYCFKGITDII